MKKTLLLLFAFALLGLLFFACQKELKTTPQKDASFGMQLSTERSNDCGPCISYGYCCCRIINLSGFAIDIEVCKGWDILECVIEAVGNCPLTKGKFNDYFTVQDSTVIYECVPSQTVFRVKNPSQTDTIALFIECPLDIIIDFIPNYFIAPGEESVIYLTSNCRRRDCN